MNRILYKITKINKTNNRRKQKHYKNNVAEKLVMYKTNPVPGNGKENIILLGIFRNPRLYVV